MSTLGSGLVAGVAQASVQAGQVARQVDARHSRIADDAGRIRQFIAAQRRDEAIADEAELSSQGRTEEQASQGHSQQEAPERGDQDRRHGRITADPSPVGDTPVPAPTRFRPGRDSPAQLYQHLDVQA